MTSDLRKAFRGALAMMGSSADDNGPLGMAPAIQNFAQMAGIKLPANFEQVVWQTLLSDDQNDESRIRFGRFIRSWDSFENADWIDGTDRHSPGRRELIYQKLGVSAEIAELIGQQIPIADSKQAVVISGKHEEWYTNERQSLHDFYWLGYEGYLRSVSGWPEESIQDLNDATTKIVERLSDPERAEIYQVKGLVVGYVQSGKTANFTAVVAKAADAGYRLIIVLAGTLNVLRAQTQRRLDRDLVGLEILKADQCMDYIDDNDWPDKFVKYGDLPSNLGHFDWRRLTDFKYDYQSLRHGISSLDFNKKSSGRRFNDPRNLHDAPARLIVIKKNPAVIKRLNADLDRIKADLEEVPTLIIDDESDQASINTKKKNASEERQRTSTNAQIIKLLETLPRSQYIGYTATPFANVFVDPDDAKDLFPKDFIVGLNRPIGYMGVRDFFDFADDGEELAEDEIPDGFLSNEKAYVRDVEGDDAEPANLRKAILSFVLSGALKLFREDKGHPVSTRHHTMLVHKSVRQLDHEEDKNQVELIYNSLREGQKIYPLIKQLWLDDFEKVSAARATNAPSIDDFENLRPYIDKCINRIEKEGEPVRVVNGDKKYEKDLPDFDAKSVWGILVGGTKLSRGYTVEGLTISYYRRKINQADTLMQVGRWFGFRRGYQDLVRLFVGRKEQSIKGQTFDLYLAFKAICQDEEKFRDQLERYASKDGEDRILPKHIPPLVPSHLLPPTSPNKMYNAEIRFQNFGGKGSEKGSTPSDTKGKRYNANLLRKFIAESTFVGDLNLRTQFVKDSSLKDLPAKVWKTSKSALIELMGAYKWNDDKKLFHREQEYLEGTGSRDPEVDEVLVIARQRSSDSGNLVWDCAGQRMSVWTRSRVDTGRFNALSGSREREVANYLAHIKSNVQVADGPVNNLRARRQAVVLIYPIIPTGEDFGSDRALKDDEVSVTFGVRFPNNSIPQEVIFGVKDESREDDIVI